ncbi:MAG: hypothetical protein KAT01_08740 [Candidatus Aminicenantes bacterium]|nr:hypothetical protein [Candidatus Aminicenantes bacterium]
MNEFCVLGVDLEGVPHRPTGMCILRGLRASTFLSYSDAEIFKCAATGALVGLLFLQEKAEVYGNFTDGAILMPKP